MIFKTVSGSHYEIDADNKKVRRIYGTHSPTSKQSDDGVWREYFSISTLEIGRSVFIIWSEPIEGEIQTTKTSRVVSIGMDVVS